ncbi:ATP-binding cassette sub-family A member 1, partial [Hondaea fermentalgiana]
MGNFGGQLVSQLRLVLLLKVRSPLRSLGEILIPVLLMFALVGIKTTADEEDFPAGIYANETQRVPEITEFLSPGWYVANLVPFYAHGMSNLAFVCDAETINDASVSELSTVITQGLGSVCETPKFVVIPGNFRNGAAAIAAQEFREYWRAQNPILDAQGRFDQVEDLIKDNEQLEEYIASDQYGTADKPRIGLAIVIESGAPDWSYSIRVNKTATYGGSEPKRNVPSIQNGRDTPTDDLERSSTEYTQQYLMSGFLTVQQEVDSYILSQSSSGANATLRVNLLAMPTSAYKSDTFWAAAGSTFAIFLVLSLLFPVAMVILEFVSLKETGQRELMFMMGLNPLAYTLAWVIFYLFFYLIVAAVLTGVSMINVFQLAAPGIIFVYFVLFLTSSLAYAFFIAAIFERTTLAIIVGLLVYFIGYFLFIPVSDSSASVGVQIFLSLIPSTAFSLGTIPFAEYEGALVPLTWDNAGSSNNGGFTFANCLAMLLIDTLLYFALALYFDATLSSSAGTARIPWYWPFTCGCLRRRSKNSSDSKQFIEAVANQTQIENELAADETANFEQVSKTMQDLRAEGRCVMLGNLSKT